MELLTTHVGADFDALASMLVARRLHPEARLFFPGSREESVRRMLESGLVELVETRRREIDPRSLTRIVLCDSRQRDRVGVVAEWIAAVPEIELWAYDHHPPTADDLPVSGGIVDPSVGSTSTILVEELQRRGLSVEPREATVLLLGVYEDTGSLTFATTAPRDLAAAAWLLTAGGDLAAVRRFAQRQLDAVHLDVLHRMVRHAEVHRIRGHRVGLATLEIGEYVEELAPLVGRCVEIFDLPLFFGVFGEGERVTVIARGELFGLDLGVLVARLGGGGHATAASAALKGVTVIEARERLLGVLAQMLPERALARELMITSFCAVPTGASVTEAKEALLRGRVNAAPVVDGTRVVGAISRQQLDAAVQHGLAERPIDTVMGTEVAWVPPTASASEVGEALLGGRARFVLVGDGHNRVASGLISRMALMSHLYARLEHEASALDRHSREQRARHRQIGKLLDERLPAAISARVAEVRELARERGEPTYLVGGIVRDLLLGRRNEDLDLVVEGDGPAFAQALAARIGARVREHAAFMTAVVIDNAGLVIDVATARSEFYRAPAALPEVRTSVLRQDLFRRDFTINTLAIRLGPERLPELVDYFGGQRDLDERQLRALHSLSFIDDPTRILRAVRFEARLGFALAAETERLVGIAIAEGAFARLSGARLREELALLFETGPTLLRAIQRLADLGVLAALHPRLNADERTTSRIERVVEVDSWFRLEGLAAPRYELWMLAIMALIADLTARERSSFAVRLGLSGARRELVTSFAERVEEAERRLADAHLLPSGVVALVRGLAGEEVLLAMAASSVLGRGRVRACLERWLAFRIRLRGRDLLAAGLPAGASIGRALAATEAARLDGAISEGEELEFAMRIARGSGETACGPS